MKEWREKDRWMDLLSAYYVPSIPSRLRYSFLSLPTFKQLDQAVSHLIAITSQSQVKVWPTYPIKLQSKLYSNPKGVLVRFLSGRVTGT